MRNQNTRKRREEQGDKKTNARKTREKKRKGEEEKRGDDIGEKRVIARECGSRGMGEGEKGGRGRGGWRG